MAQTNLLKRTAGYLQYLNETADQALVSQIEGTISARSLWADAAATTAALCTGSALTTLNVGTGAAVTTLNVGTGMGTGDTLSLGGAGSAVSLSGGRWSVQAAGHLVPGAASTYAVGSLANPTGDVWAGATTFGIGAVTTLGATRYNHYMIDPAAVAAGNGAGLLLGGLTGATIGTNVGLAAIQSYKETGAADTAGALLLVVNNAVSLVERWRVESGGVFRPSADNTLDVGTTALRTRTIYAGTSTIVGAPAGVRVTTTGSAVQSTGGAFNVGTSDANALNLQTGGSTRLAVGAAGGTIDASLLAIDLASITTNGAMRYNHYQIDPATAAVGNGAGLLLGGLSTGSSIGNNVGFAGIQSYKETAAANGQGALLFVVNDSTNLVERWRVTSTGVFQPAADNTQDIGTSGLRTRTIYAGTSVIVGSSVTITTNAVTGSGALTTTATAANLTLAATGANNVIVSTNGTARLTVADATVTVADALDFAFNTGTGTKLGTTTSQKIGFYGATPIAQGASVADATGGAVVDAEARAAINALISRIEALGLIATV